MSKTYGLPVHPWDLPGIAKESNSMTMTKRMVQYCVWETNMK